MIQPQSKVGKINALIVPTTQELSLVGKPKIIYRLSPSVRLRSSIEPAKLAKVTRDYLTNIKRVVEEA